MPPSDGTVPVGRSDLVLALLPASLLTSALMGWLFAVHLATALAYGSVPASAVVGYALFVNPPG